MQLFRRTGLNILLLVLVGCTPGTTPPATSQPLATSTASASAPMSTPLSATPTLLPTETPSEFLTVAGVISKLDTASSSFYIGRHQVVWNQQTDFFALTTRIQASDLHNQQRVAVQGHRNEQDQILATRIVIQTLVPQPNGSLPGEL